MKPQMVPSSLARFLTVTDEYVKIENEYGQLKIPVIKINRIMEISISPAEDSFINRL